MQYFRPLQSTIEVEQLANPKKNKLGWKPTTLFRPFVS